MEDNYYATIGYTKQGMFIANVKKNTLGGKITVGIYKDFSCKAVYDYIREYNIPQKNIIVNF